MVVGPLPVQARIRLPRCARRQDGGLAEQSSLVQHQQSNRQNRNRWTGLAVVTTEADYLARCALSTCGCPPTCNTVKHGLMEE
ncbi:hypothetical protein Cob_v002861 [Colletotrichum orbiculare MAFF 240422]|uniref:Uncharacterized protein n=1 Tax=Colletotrichum orbiculare (strain 104-T / ATCC 96160 / CBS 514.97 / LARS 414 / MAFF 240422) TaxID=1213857 RepID=A0A484G1A4_COLOR|nr:hypothetical protein Cob_v002861 [Colletotrichum orbiculare MAFF 240422]